MLSTKKENLTACETAFVKHIVKVCPTIDHNNGGKGLTGTTILDTWTECLDDWIAAVIWGQEHPNDKMLRNTKRNRVIKLKPRFITRKEDKNGM